MKTPNQNKLLILDFDGTITKMGFHLHNELSNAFIQPLSFENGIIINNEPIDALKINPLYDKEKILNWCNKNMKWEYFNYPESLGKLINYYFENGNAVTIATFSQYPDGIRYCLNLLPIKEEYKNMIDIISGCPIMKISFKTEHIKLALEKNNISEENVHFIDDNFYNCATSGINHTFYNGDKIDHFENFYQEIEKPLSDNILRDDNIHHSQILENIGQSYSCNSSQEIAIFSSIEIPIQGSSEDLPY